MAALKNFFIYVDSMKNTGSEKKENVTMRKAISFFGSTIKLAEKLNYANQSNVSKWLYETRLIPIKHAIKIEQLTKGEIKAKDLRPDIFED